MLLPAHGGVKSPRDSSHTIAWRHAVRHVRPRLAWSYLPALFSRYRFAAISTDRRAWNLRMSGSSPVKDWLSSDGCTNGLARQYSRVFSFKPHHIYRFPLLVAGSASIHICSSALKVLRPN